MSAVLVRDHYYAVPERVESINEDGNQEVHYEMSPFQVVGVRGSHSRPHVMHTFESADEPALYASLAVELHQWKW